VFVRFHFDKINKKDRGETDYGRKGSHFPHKIAKIEVTAFIRTMAKTRVSERLSKLTEAPKGDRSEELPALTKEFEEFTKKFEPLSDALKEHYETMQKLEQTQAKVRLYKSQCRLFRPFR
jgi:Skp family chaperone for outer membrane proteins